MYVKYVIFGIEFKFDKIFCIVYLLYKFVLNMLVLIKEEIFKE